MLNRWFVILALVALAGCQPMSRRAPMTPVSAVDASVPARCQLSDGEQVSTRTLRKGETVSDVLHDVLPQAGGADQRTVVLVRRCPEGQTEELIDVDAAGRPVDAARDVVLRDGDELILPARPTAPVGLERPPVLSAQTPQ